MSRVLVRRILYQTYELCAGRRMEIFYHRWFVIHSACNCFRSIMPWGPRRGFLCVRWFRACHKGLMLCRRCHGRSTLETTNTIDTFKKWVLHEIYTQCGTERGHVPFFPWREIEKMKTYGKLRRNSTQDMFAVMMSRNQKITALISNSACRLLIRKRSKDSSAIPCVSYMFSG